VTYFTISVLRGPYAARTLLARNLSGVRSAS
jgi:hypothetical protein